MKWAPSLLLFAAGVCFLVASVRPVTSSQPVVVPYYGAAYGGGGMSAADGKRVVELLESIDARLSRIETAGGIKPAAKLDPLPVAKTKCAACHTQTVAEAKGGGFILFADDGATALKPLSAREKTRIKESVQSGTMPPAKPLSASEKAAFDW